MNIKRIIAGVLAVCVMGAIMPSVGGKTADNAVITANAYTEETYEQLTYQKYGDYIKISDCDESATEVVIPDEIDGMPVKKIGTSAFKDCSSLTSINIPDSVISIGGSVFENCTELVEITIPNGVTDISNWTFENCTGLTKITMPNGVTSIGQGAFYGCENLIEITIPDSVTYIWNQAFYGCKSLTEITIPDGVANIDYSTFYNCSELTKINIPNSVTSIGKSAFCSCKSLTSITIPESVTSIDDETFSGCTSLKEITIPNGVTGIGDSAFSSCTSLTEITIPDSVTSIGDSAFSFCKSLTEIYIPNSVTSIGASAFANCTELTAITIPNSVINIGGCAFYNCTSLTEITIPDGVTSIGYRAFERCSSLTKLTIPDSVTSIGGIAFQDCPNLTLITTNADFMTNTELGLSDILSVNYPRPKLNYTITESEDNKSNIANRKSIEAEIDYSTINNTTSWEFTTEVGRLQECKDSKGNIYAIGGYQNSVILLPENTKKNPITIKNEGFTFGSAVIDDNDNLFILWGYSISEDNIKEEQEKNTENLVVIKYDLNGKILGRCGIPIQTSDAQYPFGSGNASMAVKDNVVGCFFDTHWTKLSDGRNHQVSEFAAIDKNNMELITFSYWEGAHSFGVSLIPTEYGFAGIQKGDANDTARGINFNSYLVSDNKVETSHLAKNGYKLLFSASGQYGENGNHIDGNNTYLHMGGLAKSATTYAVVGKSERVYSTMEYYGNSDLRTNNYDVFLKITDQTLAQTASDLAGEERVDVETGETADYNIIWLTECNETEKAGQCKVVTLADSSYCVLWEKFVNDKFDSIRYVVTDECGNILRHETGIYGARLSDTSVQPIVDEYTLKWAVADKENQCINFYTVDLNEFSETPTKDVFGDANCDGKVTIADSTAILQSLGNPDKYGLSEQGAINADCCNHGDGVMTSDALAIQMVDAGMLKQEQLPIAKLPDIKN